VSRRIRKRGASRGPRFTWPVRIGALAVLALAVLALAWGFWTVVGPGPRAAQGESFTTVVLARGDHLPVIAADLRRARVIRSAALFVAAVEVTGSAHLLKAGEYAIPSGANMIQILSALRSGKVVRHLVTIPEGITSQVVAEILRRSDFLVGRVATPPEGQVLPETYDARRGESRAAVLGRMMAARSRLLAALWRDRAPGLPYASAQQAVTLASIVEKETAKPEERPRIAAVFLNRLRLGMRLESDPTVIYGLTGGAALGHGLRVSELASDTAYNTYRIGGLPPGPIANPGRAALAAALAPARTADLYFVADGTGGHVFAATLADHLKNVARWRAVEQARASGTAN
jgi:UPF0755 protein